MAIAYPSAVQPGDLAVLTKIGSAPGGSWGVVAALGAHTPGIYSVSLGPTDIITPLAPNAKWTCLVYRGVQSIAARVTSATQGPPGTDTRLGFTADPNCAGRVAVAGVDPAYGIPTVGTFTIRATQADTGMHWNVLDNPSVDPSTIAAGVTVTWNTTDPSGPGWVMCELLK